MSEYVGRHKRGNKTDRGDLLRAIFISLITTATLLITRFWPFAMIAFFVALGLVWLMEDVFERDDRA